MISKLLNFIVNNSITRYNYNTSAYTQYLQTVVDAKKAHV